MPLRRATATGDRLAASVLTKVEVLAGMRASEEGRYASPARQPGLD